MLNLFPRQIMPHRKPELQHLPKDVLQNAAVLVVRNFFRRIDARDSGNCVSLPSLDLARTVMALPEPVT